MSNFNECSASKDRKEWLNRSSVVFEKQICSWASAVKDEEKVQEGRLSRVDRFTITGANTTPEAHRRQQ